MMTHARVITGLAPRIHRRPALAPAPPPRPRARAVPQVYCLGFAAVGATLANLLLSGVGQVLTAAFTRFLLRKRLTNGQLAGISCVFLGLAVRAAPAAYFGDSSAGGGGGGAQAAAAAGGLALGREQAVGAAWVALAALLYSLLVRAGRAGGRFGPARVLCLPALRAHAAGRACLSMEGGHCSPHPRHLLGCPRHPPNPTPLDTCPAGRGLRAAAQGRGAAASQRRNPVERVDPG